jgi:DNA-binding NtrC family response regulator
VNAQDMKITRAHIAAALPPPNGNGDGRAAKGAVAAATDLGRPSGGSPEDPLRASLPLRKAWKADHLAELLRRHKGNRRIVAQELGVSERTIYRKLKEFGLASWILPLSPALLQLLESLS